MNVLITLIIKKKTIWQNKNSQHHHEGRCPVENMLTSKFISYKSIKIGGKENYEDYFLFNTNFTENAIILARTSATSG